MSNFHSLTLATCTLHLSPKRYPLFFSCISFLFLSSLDTIYLILDTFLIQQKLFPKIKVCQLQILQYHPLTQIRYHKYAIFLPVNLLYRFIPTLSLLIPIPFLLAPLTYTCNSHLSCYFISLLATRNSKPATCNFFLYALRSTLYANMHFPFT